MKTRFLSGIGPFLQLGFTNNGQASYQHVLFHNTGLFVVDV